MGKKTYQLSWEITYLWIKAVNVDQSKAFCKLCQKSFSISGSGEVQVKSHAKSMEVYLLDMVLQKFL